jgi:hypothetical protein
LVGPQRLHKLVPVSVLFEWSPRRSRGGFRLHVCFHGVDPFNGALINSQATPLSGSYSTNLGRRMNLNKSLRVNIWERRPDSNKCFDIFNNMVPSGKPEISKNCRGFRSGRSAVPRPVIYGTGTAACRKEETLHGMPVDFTQFLAQPCQGS